MPRSFGSGDARCSFSKLQEQGFSGQLDKGATIEFIGPVGNGKTKINTYYYDFTNPESRHGNHRLIILDLRCRYLGSYAVNEKPLSVEGNKIVFRDTGIPGNLVEFSGDSLPDRIWIDGDISSLGR